MPGFIPSVRFPVHSPHRVGPVKGGGKTLPFFPSPIIVARINRDDGSSRVAPLDGDAIWHRNGPPWSRPGLICPAHLAGEASDHPVMSCHCPWSAPCVLHPAPKSLWRSTGTIPRDRFPGRPSTSKLGLAQGDRKERPLPARPRVIDRFTLKQAGHCIACISETCPECPNAQAQAQAHYWILEQMVRV